MFHENSRRSVNTKSGGSRAPLSSILKNVLGPPLLFSISITKWYFGWTRNPSVPGSTLNRARNGTKSWQQHLKSGTTVRYLLLLEEVLYCFFWLELSMYDIPNTNPWDPVFKSNYVTFGTKRKVGVG